MRKTLGIILVFAVVLAACLGIAELLEILFPEEQTVPQEESVVIANDMQPDAATTIVLDETGAHVTGLGAEANETGVRIVYPGTYRISGTMADGQIRVDCDQFHGGVYIMLDGADVTCSTGPAIYVKQSDKTVIHLVEGTVNTLRDGEGYTIMSGGEETYAAAVYCDDDLYLEGTGALTVIGSNADGIRSRDAFTMEDAMVTVYAADDGVQGSDCVDIRSGTLSVTAAGDGITTKKGDVMISGGAVTVVSEGDGIAAETDVYMSGGTLSVTAYGGSTNYETMAVNGLSAKGIKGENIYVSGGTVLLDTADDGVCAELTASLSGGVLTLRSGDDALCAAENLNILGGTIAVETSYEGMEAPEILVENGAVTIDADNDGIDAPGSYCQTGGYVAVSAPQCLQTDGSFAVEGGWLLMAARETGSPLSFAEGSVTGGTLFMTGTGTAAEFSEGGVIPGSFTAAFPSTLTAGTIVGVEDAAHTELLSFTTVQSADVVLVASGAMGVGFEYTVAAGDTRLTGVLAGAGTLVS